MGDFDQLLTPRPVPPEPAALREAVTADAARVQRRRRWLVRGRRFAVVAATYAAGLASMDYWSASRQPIPPAVAGLQTPPEPPVVIPSDVDPYRNDPPERIERWAFVQS